MSFGTRSAALPSLLVLIVAIQLIAMRIGDVPEEHRH